MKKSHPFDLSHYKGSSPSTLCLGCGHDQVSKHIAEVAFDLQLDPAKIVKVSGIGCSSKTPNYFLKASQGFNTIHGRMASVATGIKLAHSQLKIIGISGDGDTGNIGLGSFLHAVRKNVPLIYLVENNGVYGLTRGQFSVTAPQSSSLKNKKNLFLEIDLCRLALEAGCGFVARTFSGDKKQMHELLKLAFQYEGFALIDIISPCVAYGNDQDFSYSFSSMKKKRIILNELDIIEGKQPTQADLSSGEKQFIPLGPHSHLVIKKLKERQHDFQNLTKASELLKNNSEKKEIATGLIYYNATKTLLDNVNLCSQPLVSVSEQDLKPSPKDLKEIMRVFT